MPDGSVAVTETVTVLSVRPTVMLLPPLTETLVIWMSPTVSSAYAAGPMNPPSAEAAASTAKIARLRMNLLTVKRTHPPDT